MHLFPFPGSTKYSKNFISVFSCDSTENIVLQRQRESCAAIATLLLLVSCLLPSSSHAASLLRSHTNTPRLEMILHFIIHSEGNTN